MTRKTKDNRDRCDLATNPDSRRAADALAASVKDAFPPGLSQPALRAMARDFVELSHDDTLELLQSAWHESDCSHLC